jgi:hypothetical protein
LTQEQIAFAIKLHVCASVDERIAFEAMGSKHQMVLLMAVCDTQDA